MVHFMVTLGELIDGLGGGAAVARLIGISPSAVSHWRREGSVPPERRLELWRLAVRAGIEWRPPGVADVTLTVQDAPAPAEAA
jgi:hypothetical protein